VTWQTTVQKTISAVASPFSFPALSGGGNENHFLNRVTGKTRTVYLPFGTNQTFLSLQIPKLYTFKIPIFFMNNPVLADTAYTAYMEQGTTVKN
jgi:hypothetical protein